MDAKTLEPVRKIFSKTQIFFICFGILAQLSFVATIKNYFNTGSWGYPRLKWFIPNRMISFGWFEASSNSIITCHIITSYCLYISLLLQLCMMLFLKRTTIMLRMHRAIGITIVFLFLPVFMGFALALNAFLIQDNINKILFSIIPVMIFYGLLKGVLAIQSGQRESHVDGIFLALILLNSASVFRLLMGILFITGIPISVLFTDNEPNYIAAITRTFLMIIILSASFYSCGRLKQNRFPVIALTTVLFLATLMCF